MTVKVGVIMGSDSDWSVMQGCCGGPEESWGECRGDGGFGTPNA